MASRIHHDRLTINDGGSSRIFGSAPRGPEITVVDPSVYEAVLRAGSVALGETYAQGWWDTNDLTECLRVLLRATRPALQRRDRIVRHARFLTDRSANLHHADRTTDQRNVRAHYDLSNEFFALMLDPTMAYSCAIFERPDASLEEGSIAKFERVCRSLDLRPDDHVVEIGSGWGGFAIHAAKHHGCRVTTTTISQEQFDYTEKRIASEGLADRVTVRDEHYRDLDGRYDKLVSIEMIEAVPWWELHDYFACVDRLVRRGGQALIQVITMNDASYERSKRHDDFIKHYIFPGSNIPSISALMESARHTQLRLQRLDDIGAHYPPTLRAWAANIDDNADEIDAVAPHLANQHFRRQWQFYLAYCEAAFLEQHISAAHTLWTAI